MELEKTGVVLTVHHVGGQQQRITRALAVQIIALGHERIAETVVQIRGQALVKRRQQRNASVLAVQAPRFARADVLDERLEIPLHDDAHVADAALRDVGKYDVYRAVTACKRQRRNGPMRYELAEKRIAMAGIDDCKGIVHVSVLPYLVVSEHYSNVAFGSTD